MAQSQSWFKKRLIELTVYKCTFKENPDQLVEAYSKALGIGNYSGNTWTYDQVILSRIILESDLCTVPKHNMLWKTTRLIPPEKEIDDSDTCYHGIDVSKNSNVECK